MKKGLIITGLVLCCLAAVAQDCTKENVTTLPGKWKPGMKGASDHSAADMVKEKALMDDVIQTIRKSFTWQPTGGEITYGNVYSIRGLDYRPLPVIQICHQYYPYIHYQHYYCANGKVGLEDYIVEVTANINDLPFDFSETFFKSKKDRYGNATEDDPETEKYGYIQNLPVEKNGIIEYTKTVYGSSTGGDITTKFRILTKPGQSPFYIVKKRENYERWKTLHLKNIAEYESIKVKLASQPTVDNSLIASQNGSIATERNYIAKIDEILNSKGSDDLAKPAFMGEEYGNYYEVGKADRFLNYIIRPNLAYYNSQLPKSSPQVITIKYRYKCTTDKYGDKLYADEAFYNELERIKIMDLLTAKLQPLIAK